MSRPKILVIDDEPNVLRALYRLLFEENLDINITSSPVQALDSITKEKFAVVISDQNLPGINGTKLLKRIREIAPETVRIMLTAYPNVQAAIEGINEGYIFRFLTKPWIDEQIVSTIHEAIRYYEENDHSKGIQQRYSNLVELNRCLIVQKIEKEHELYRLNREYEQEQYAALRVLAGLARRIFGVVPSGWQQCVKKCSDTLIYPRNTKNLSSSQRFFMISVPSAYQPIPFTNPNRP